MANVQSIRQALATQLATGLNIQALPNMPAVVTTPMIMVMPGSPYIQYGQTMGETADALGAVMGTPVSPTQSKNNIMLTVLVVISMAMGYEPMQPALDAMLEPAGNPGSIPDVIALDETLGGAVDFAVPLDITGYGLVNIAGQDYFGAHMRIQIGA